MSYVVGILLFVAGGFIGLKFPDADAYFRWHPLLEHRSILTHSILLPLLLWLGMRRTLTVPARLFLMGLGLAIAVHLAFDLYPYAWRGYARIHVPFYGWLPSVISKFWIAGSVVACLILAFKQLRNIPELSLAILGLIVAYGVHAAATPRFSFFALIALLIAVPLGFLLARPEWQRGDDGNGLLASKVRQLRL